MAIIRLISMTLSSAVVTFFLADVAKCAKGFSSSLSVGTSRAFLGGTNRIHNNDALFVSGGAVAGSTTELYSSATETVVEESSTTTSTSSTPSWEELSLLLKEKENDDDDADDRKPLVTLYRDTNGWCPFCERVWIALRIKNIPYQERLVNLQDKPEWFLDMVPTGLVPALLIHSDTILQNDNDDDDEEEKKTPPKRTLVWESQDILKALDEQFPDTPKLMFDDQDNYLEGREILGNLTTSGFAFSSYNANNQSSVTEETKQQQQIDFESKLDALEGFLAKSSDDGPYLLGSDMTGLDIEAIPILERWRYQMPLSKQFHLCSDNHRPHLSQWFQALDENAAYADRVTGDQYSWSAVLSTFIRMFSSFGMEKGKELPKDTLAAIERADQSTHSLLEQFLADDSTIIPSTAAARVEAATKLLQNHEAVVNDCTNPAPKSQKDLERASDPQNADWVLRRVVANLLEFPVPTQNDNDDVDVADAAKAARVVAARLCAPRDMGAPAATALRQELMKISSVLS